MNGRPLSAYLDHPLLVLSGLLILLSVVFFPLSQRPIHTELLEVSIPIAISLGIALYTVRVLRIECESERMERITLLAWVGALIALISILVILQQLREGTAISHLFDEVLTVVSIGSGVGACLGAIVSTEQVAADRTGQDHLLTETLWTNESPPNPILTTITTEIAELEGVEPVELDPLYEHVNPAVFTELQERDGSQWQLFACTDDYEIRVSSHGTVTIYSNESCEEEPGSVHLLDEKW